MKRKNRNLLLRSFDASLSGKEQGRLENALQADPALRREKEQLEQMRQKLDRLPPQKFEPYFTRRVMNRLTILKKGPEAADLLFESLQSLFKPVMVFSLMLIAGIITYNITANKDVTLAGLMPAEELALQNAFTPSFMGVQE